MLSMMNVLKDTDCRLIGVSGPNHAGKDSVGERLADYYGFMHISISDVLRAEARQRNLDTERETLIAIGVELRREGGKGAIVDKGIEQWQAQKEKFLGGLVLSSVRAPFEAQEIKNRFGKIWYVDAPVEIRFQRGLDRPRADRTAQTHEEYIEAERAEMHGLKGPEQPHILGVKAIADVILTNDRDPEYLNQQIDDLMAA
jgi:dephospho-CoA kinase